MITFAMTSKTETVVERCASLSVQLTRDYFASDHSDVFRQINDLQGARAALVMRFMRSSMTLTERMVFDADFEQWLNS